MGVETRVSEQYAQSPWGAGFLSLPGGGGCTRAFGPVLA
jgi:hypothetical protein